VTLASERREHVERSNDDPGEHHQTEFGSSPNFGRREVVIEVSGPRSRVSSHVGSVVPYHEKIDPTARESTFTLEH
jgi:hypothetical protein